MPAVFLLPKIRGCDMKKEVIEYMKISDIKPYENNPRIHKQEDIEKIAKSIETVGFKQPIVVDKNNVIICGHGRYFASKFLGLEEIPCIKATDLSDEKVKFLRVIDNRLNELSDWNSTLLNKELEELEAVLHDINMEDFGFDIKDTDEAIDLDGYIQNKNGQNGTTVHRCPKCGFEYED